MKRLNSVIILTLLVSTLGQMNFDMDTLQGGPELLASDSSSSGAWVPRSPCENVFMYQWWGRDIIGIAKLSPPVRSSRTESIKVLMTLQLEALLPDNYVGTLELHEDKEIVFSRLLRGDPSPILYRIRFPLKDPIPSLTKIVVNDRIVCQGSVVTPSHAPVTILNLDHTLYPGGTALNSNSDEQNLRPQRPNFSIPPGSTWNPPARPPPPTQPPQIISVPVNTPPPFRPTQIHTMIDATDRTECGQVIRNQLALGLVVDGVETERGDWPWITAIFVKTNKGQDFQCGGSLISVKHIITAAHCIKMPNKREISPDKITVFLGKFNLFRAEHNTQHRDISKTILHPSYGGEKFDNDIAILFLESPADITFYVRPVCLWPEDKMSLDNVINKKGMVVGWGRDENGNTVSEKPKLVIMPLVSQEECLRSHYHFQTLTNNNTYCAGGRDGSGPCSGDSGGGMYFLEPTSSFDNRWMLRGLVSLSLPDEQTKMCDLSNFIVFTDVAKYTPWIKAMTGLI